MTPDLTAMHDDEGMRHEHFAIGRKRGLFLFLASIALVVLILWLLVGTFFVVDVNPAYRLQTILFDLVFSVILCLPLVLLVRVLLKTQGLSADVYPDRFELRRRSGALVIPWEDVDAVWVTVRRGTGVPMTQLVVQQGAIFALFMRRFLAARRYKVQLKDGTVFKVPTQLSRSADFGAIIERESCRVLLPEAIATYNRGGSVTFGDLSLSRHGFKRGDHTLQWNDYERIELSDGQLLIYRPGRRFRWAAISTCKVANLAVLQSLVETVGPTRG